MALILKLGDPRPVKSDQVLSEQVELVAATNVSVADHEDDVNAFLISLRDDTNHTIAIRTILFNLESMTGGGKITGVTTIHYLLVGNTDPPYIP